MTVATDSLSTNNDWWTYNGYIQESYSRGKLRLNGGVRYDWQQSKQLAGCTPAATLAIQHPSTGALVLPAFCQDETSTDPITGKQLRAFSQFAPRVSATYDLFGNGKTQLHSSYSLYYATKITLANQLNNIGGISLSWGNMNNNGTCAGTTTSCWQDLNLDGFVQVNELSWVAGGIQPGARIPGGPGRFNVDTGAITPGINAVDDSAQIGRTREAIVGMQHELIANLAVGVDYIYRNYDRGTTGYTQGMQPGCADIHDDPVRRAGLSGVRSVHDPQHLYGSGDWAPGAVLHRADGDALHIWPEQHHDDQPELQRLPRRHPAGEQALQRQVADEHVDHPLAEPGVQRVLHQSDGRGVHPRHQQHRAVSVQDERSLRGGLGHHGVGQLQHERRRQPHALDRRPWRQPPAQGSAQRPVA